MMDEEGLFGSGQCGSYLSVGVDLEVYSRYLGGCSSMVERQPSKLDMWVRFPSPAPVRWICRSVGRKKRGLFELRSVE